MCLAVCLSIKVSLLGAGARVLRDAATPLAARHRGPRLACVSTRVCGKRDSPLNRASTQT